MKRKSYKQAAAGILIAGILWTFVSCLMFCGESDCFGELPGAGAVSVVVHENDADVCPVTADVKLMAADRLDFGAGPPILTFSRSAFVPKQRIDRVRDRVFNPRTVIASPPLERLPMLRI